MIIIRKLTAILRQQTLGALALFVALGGSAYAAATINSASVVDDSLTSADVKGRAAGPGKPFTQGTITGADVKGSPGVNGALTGADVANGSIGSADLFPAMTAQNSAKLGGVIPSGYAQTTRASHERTGACATVDQGSECAKVTVAVPPGRKYRAVVNSSFSALAPTVDTEHPLLRFCPAVKEPDSDIATCLGPLYNVSLFPNYAESAQAVGDTVASGFDLTPGTWTFSTVLYTFNSLSSSSSYTAHTTVSVTDASAPGPAVGG